MELQHMLTTESQIKISKVANDTLSSSSYYNTMEDDRKAQLQMLQHTKLSLEAETLLLQHEQRTNQQKFKEISNIYTDVFKNYLDLLVESNKRNNLMLLTIHELRQINQLLPSQIQILIMRIMKINIRELFNVNSQINQEFLIDFHNYFPNWQSHITQIIQLQLNSASKIQNIFECQDKFPFKLLFSLKFCLRIKLFMSQIFQIPIKQILSYHEQLSFDFNYIYTAWHQTILKSSKKGPFHSLYSHIIANKSVNQKNITKLKQQISQLMGTRLAQSQKLLNQISQLQKKKQVIKYLFSQINFQQITEKSINKKLTVLVWKKINQNRRKIQSILNSVINQMLNNYDTLPKQIKYIIQQYCRLVTIKYGEIKNIDYIKFFNKLIFSNLYLSQLKTLLQKQLTLNENIKNYNITIITSFLKKIIQNYPFSNQKKYDFINQLISHYSKPIQQFIFNFVPKFPITTQPYPKKQRAIFPILMSLQSLKYLYQSMKAMNTIPQLSKLEALITDYKQLSMVANQYQLKNLYLVMIYKSKVNHQQIFSPKDQINKKFILFLKDNYQIPQSTAFQTVIEHDRYAYNQICQTYSTYQILGQKQYSLRYLCSNIKQSITKIKSSYKNYAIQLQKQYRKVKNIKNLYLTIVTQNKKNNAKTQIKNMMTNLLQSPLDFHYEVIHGKICQIQQSNKPFNSFWKYLNDIAQFYRNDKCEGCDQLYRLALQKIGELLSRKNIIKDKTIQLNKIIQQLIGTKLYQILKIGTSVTSTDQKIYKQMKKHKFVDFKLLQLDQYIDQQQIIEKQSLNIYKKIKSPQSPYQLIKHFHDLTLIFQNIIMLTGKPQDLSADIQIPMMMYVLIKSQIRNLSTLIKFIQKLITHEINSSVLGQTLTLIQGACYLIQNMGVKQLNVSAEHYVSMCEEQGKKNLSSIFSY